MKKISLVLLFITGLYSNLLATSPPILHKNRSSSFKTFFKQDTLNTTIFHKDHSPQKAAWYSAIMPGLGQAYNKKYWKVPLVWLGVGSFIYFIDYNNNLYQFYRKNLIYEIEQNPNFKNTTHLDSHTLKRARDKYRRDRDYLFILGCLFYILNIVDAHVDAHLSEFDINNKLSFQLTPLLQSNSNQSLSTGISLKIKL